MQHSAETVQRLNRYSGRPSDREPAQANLKTLQSRAVKPRADFNWPPTEERLTAGRHAGTNNVAAGEAGQAIVRDDEAVMDAVPTLSEADEPEYVGDSVSVLAAAQSEAAFDGTGSGDWAADLARLQAAIERVAEKVEWRITGATGH